MHAWEQIQQTVNYIEDHLNENMLHYTLVDEEVPLITDGIVLEIHREELKEPVHYMGLIKDVPIHHIDGLGTESGLDPLASLWDDFHKQTCIDLCF